MYKNDSDDEEEDDDTPKAPNPKLAQGSDLPKRYGQFPLEMASVPLVDIDPYYADKRTFIVITFCIQPTLGSQGDCAVHSIGEGKEPRSCLFQLSTVSLNHLISGKDSAQMFKISFSTRWDAPAHL